MQQQLPNESGQSRQIMAGKLKPRPIPVSLIASIYLILATLNLGIMLAALSGLVTLEGMTAIHASSIFIIVYFLLVSILLTFTGVGLWRMRKKSHNSAVMLQTIVLVGQIIQLSAVIKVASLVAILLNITVIAYLLHPKVRSLFH